MGLCKLKCFTKMKFFLCPNAANILFNFDQNLVTRSIYNPSVSPHLKNYTKFQNIYARMNSV